VSMWVQWEKLHTWKWGVHRKRMCCRK